MRQTQWLRPDQEKAVSIYMDKFGVDAGVQVLLDFEKGKSLGRAMIKHKDHMEEVCHERNNCKSIQI